MPVSSDLAQDLEIAQTDQEIINLLMHHNVLPKDLNNKIPGFGDTLLHTAVWANNLVLVKFLLKHGADPKITNDKGERPEDIQLTAAAESPSIEILKALIEHRPTPPIMVNEAKVEKKPELKVNPLKLPEEFFLLTTQLPEKPWLDIPKMDALTALSGKTPFAELIRTITHYHSLVKTDKSTIKQRLELLSSIENQVKILLPNITDKNELAQLQELQKAAFGKQKYLSMIGKRELTKNWFKNFVFGGLTEDNLLLRTVRHDVTSFELGIPQLLCEVKEVNENENAIAFLDPCLRAGFQFDVGGRGKNDPHNVALFQSLYQIWQFEMKAAPKQPPFPSFYMWLEDQDDATKLFNPNPQQGIELLELRKCSIEDGVIKLANGTKNLNFSGTVTVNAKGELFISERDSWSNVLNHPNIHFGFEPILFAGSIQVKDGKITMISNHSGHYVPGPSYFKQFEEMMLRKNCVAPDCDAYVYYATKEGGIGHRASKVGAINYPEILSQHHHKIRNGSNTDGTPKFQFMTSAEIVTQVRIESTNKLEAKFATRALEMHKKRKIQKLSTPAPIIDERKELLANPAMNISEDKNLRFFRASTPSMPAIIRESLQFEDSEKRAGKDFEAFRKKIGLSERDIVEAINPKEDLIEIKHDNGTKETQSISALYEENQKNLMSSHRVK